VNHELSIIGEFEPDDLQQVPGTVRSNRQDLGRVRVGFDVDDGDGVAESVQDGDVADGVFAGCAVDFRISIS
jgi:hypothetical protein